MRKIFFPIAAICIISSCSIKPPLERVKLEQAYTKRTYKPIDEYKKEIKWTDDNGVTRIVTRGERDSITGEEITTVELSEVVVTARSKNVAERNGKIDLDFIVTVPASLINNKWQVQLTPVAYKKGADTLYLDKIFLSGADFAKMQKKGYMQYQAFISSIIPSSEYATKMFDSKGYKNALRELEEEYYQAWKNEVLLKESWIDWSDRINERFILFNSIMERNKQSIAGQNTILKYFPAYWLERDLSASYVPGKWKMFVDGNYQIRTKSITPEDSIEISKRFTDYKKIAENQRKKEMVNQMYNKYVRFPYQPARLDTIIREGKNFVYYYKQEIPATENISRIDLTLNGEVVTRDEARLALPPSDTITYFVTSMVQMLDSVPRYRKQIVTRKDEVNRTAYINFEIGKSSFDASLGNNKEEIDSIYSTIRNINYTGTFLIDSIYMTATSSPEGSSTLNKQLSRERAVNLKKYLLQNTDDPEGVDSLFRPKWIGEDWKKLREFIAKDDSISSKREILQIIDKTSNEDVREDEIKKFDEYEYIRNKYYPLLRAVKFQFHLHRRGMIQDTIVMPVIDESYKSAISLIKQRKYKEALVLLNDMYPDDYNTAICLMSMGYDSRALEIMKKQKETSDRDYIMAILYARLKNEAEAVKSFIRSCDLDENKIWKGRLDPEINALIETYNLYQDEY